MVDFEQIAKNSAKIRKQAIVLIPENCKINPVYLDSMSNQEFIQEFKKLQKLIIDIYADVEKNPFSWGYPEESNSEELFSIAYNRISDFFKEISNGVPDNATIRDIKSHLKKVDLILKQLNKFGFMYSKKSNSVFDLTYESNPFLFKILCLYAKAQNTTIIHGWSQRYTFGSFSYRWIEDPAEQKYEPIFLVYADCVPMNLKEIQYWLYAKAKEYGYSLDKKKPFNKNAPYYKKGSKEFILAGIKDRNVFTKVIFRNVFSLEPDKIVELDKKMPGVFGKSDSNCSHCGGFKGMGEACIMRICYDLNGENHENCAYKSFYFIEPTLSIFRDIFELFIIENNIK